MPNDETPHWVAYTPLNSPRENNPQNERPAREAHSHGERTEVLCEVQVLFHSLDPGQAEIRFTLPTAEATHADVLRAAVRELQTALDIFAD